MGRRKRRKWWWRKKMKMETTKTLKMRHFWRKKRKWMKMRRSRTK